jgi:hypothetical protein
LDENTFYKLGMRKNNAENPFTEEGMLKAAYKKVNRVGFHNRFKTLIDIEPPDPFKYTQKDMVSRSVLSKLVRNGERANKRELTLQTITVDDKDRDTSDEE